jgi:NAD(P)H-dependent flavin oxidoreductase YrpB (nitropropane dioxygenase family)
LADTVEFLDRIGLEHPVVQAGMGGGVAGGELAGAVSAAGALGTVGFMPLRPFGEALTEARRRAPSRPVAANLLVPFVRPAHVRACIEHDVALVVLHGGVGRSVIGALRAAGVPVLVTVGDVAQARQALAANASGLVVQGVEAGGHLMGQRSLAEVLPAVLAVAGDVPVLAAGGVADADDVRRLLAAGATAAVAGTRFLLTEESRAHPEYQRRVLHADRTLRTLLFGVGWPLPHRVVPNAATDRWCARNELGPTSARVVSRVTGRTRRLLPLSAMTTAPVLQRPGAPLFTPALPLAGMPAESVDRSALYAGETLHRIDQVLAAAEAVAHLLP